MVLYDMQLMSAGTNVSDTHTHLDAHVCREEGACAERFREDEPLAWRMEGCDW